MGPLIAAWTPPKHTQHIRIHPCDFHRHARSLTAELSLPHCPHDVNISTRHQQYNSVERNLYNAPLRCQCSSERVGRRSCQHHLATLVSDRRSQRHTQQHHCADLGQWVAQHSRKLHEPGLRLLDDRLALRAVEWNTKRRLYRQPARELRRFHETEHRTWRKGQLSKPAQQRGLREGLPRKRTRGWLSRYVSPSHVLPISALHHITLPLNLPFAKMPPY